MELTPQQVKILERLHSRGFEIVAFPMYAQYVGVKRGPQVGGESSLGQERGPQVGGESSLGQERGPQVDGESSLGDLSCAALLAPLKSGGFSIYTKPTLLIDGNFTVRITRDGRDYFVWKKQSLEATPARLAALDSFAAALADALLPTE